MIPDGTLYQGNEISAGSIATIELATINTLEAGGAIGFGQAVAIEDGKAVVATKAPIYGVALKRKYLDADHFTQEAIDADKWKNGEVLGVVRDGTIQVPISADVEAQENATVDANGNFKPAGSSDTVVGTFLSRGNADGTARLQIRIQAGGGSTASSATASTSNSAKNAATADTKASK